MGRANMLLVSLTSLFAADLTGRALSLRTTVSTDTLDFPQDGFQAPTSDSDPLPVVEILYPAKGCRERFVLLVPPDRTLEYNPVAELKLVLTMILDRAYS